MLSEWVHCKRLWCSAGVAAEDVNNGGEVGQRFGSENSDPNVALPKSKIPGLKEKPSFGDGESVKSSEANKSRKRQRA